MRRFLTMAAAGKERYRFMKKILTFLKNRLTETCIYFTVIMFIMATIMQIASDKLTVDVFLVSQQLLIFAFALILAFVNLIFRIRRLNLPTKLLLHALATLASFVLVFGVITKKLSNAQSMLSLLLIVAILYVVIVVIALIIRAIYRRDTADKAEYDPQFTSDNNDKK